MHRPEHTGSDPAGELATPVVAALLVLAIGATLVGVTCRGAEVGADPPASVSAPAEPATTAWAGGSAMIDAWNSASTSSITIAAETASDSTSWRPDRAAVGRFSCSTAFPSAGRAGDTRSRRSLSPVCG